MKDGLTPKQKAFADYYIECGNATEAARRAGYKAKSARQIATENLSKPSIYAYIAERQKQIEDSRIADAAEVMQFFTRVLRGEEKDAFGLDISASDKMAAGREILKRNIDSVKLENERERLKLEKMRVQSQIKEDSDEKVDKILQNMDTLYERLKPVPDRNIEDFE